MDILKAFELCDKQYPVNIQGTIEEPLFQAGQIGLILGNVNIRGTLKSYDKCEVVKMNLANTNTYFLTKLGLFRLLGASRKPIARVFQRWVCVIIDEIITKGKYDLDEKLRENNFKYEENNIINAALAKERLIREKHHILLDAYDNKHVVYFVKIKDFGDTEFVIKIGYSKDIKQRVICLQKRFGACIILSVYECIDKEKFELFLHHHPYIEPLEYKDPINDIVSTETFKVNEEQLKRIEEIAKNERCQYNNSFEKNKELLEIDKGVVELRIQERELELKKVENEKENLKLARELKTELAEAKLKEYLDTIDTSPTIPQNIVVNNVSYVKKRENTRSPRVQKYKPLEDNTFELVKTYDDIITSIRENDGTSAAAMRSAARENTLYKGFRWLMIPREEDVQTAKELPPTVKNNTPTKELIAMLDIKKEYIAKVFATKKEAAEDRNMKSIGSICNSITRGSICSGHYFMYYDECADELKDAFLANGNVLPAKPTPTGGIKVQQIDPDNETVIETFNSMADVIKKFQVSRGTIKDAIDQKLLYKGYLWALV